MPITIRLDPTLEQTLEAFSRRFARTKSDVIKASLREYLDACRLRDNPYRLGEDLFGKEGREETVSNHKAYLRKRMREKNAD